MHERADQIKHGVKTVSVRTSFTRRVLTPRFVSETKANCKQQDEDPSIAFRAKHSINTALRATDKHIHTCATTWTMAILQLMQLPA